MIKPISSIPSNRSALRLENISKTYGQVEANKHINLTIFENEIHAIVGENGAGKSTLMNIIYGVVEPDEGTIEIWGKPVKIQSSLDAIRCGIGMVFQHFTLASTLTVMENVILGMEPSHLGWLDRRKMEDAVNRLNDLFGFQVPPHALVRDLTVSQQQRVEILKTLYRNAKLIILDEPTAVLTPQEIESLFEIIRKLKAEGHTIIFISHKLMEVKSIADRISVLRQGKWVATVDTKSVSPADIANMMVGRDVISRIQRPAKKDVSCVAEIRNLTVLSDANTIAVRNFSLNIYGGEILGIAGVEGNGQTQLLECLSGLRPARSGKIIMQGKEITSNSVESRRNLGLAFIPPDRRTSGVAEQAKIYEVLLADRINRYPYRSGILINQSIIRKTAQELISEYQIKAAGPDAEVKSLSGGNIQKVVLAREISCKPKILIAAEPTRGVDVAAAEYAHQQILNARQVGVAILLITSDLDELLLLSDRIIIMYKGEIVAIEKNTKDLDRMTIGRYMLGVDKQDPLKIQQHL
jgi:simple sugar transport system ATP-binding protein